MTSDSASQDSARGFIRHVVFFSAKDAADLPEIMDGLSILKDIPHSQLFEIVQNRKADLFGNDADIVVYAEFATEADFHAYKAHPLYQESIRRVRPLRDMRIAADF